MNVSGASYSHISKRHSKVMKKNSADEINLHSITFIISLFKIHHTEKYV